ncbi:hypothetical protein METHPM2_260006 [Pseudomonas sp. PM2]
MWELACLRWRCRGQSGLPEHETFVIKPLPWRRNARFTRPPALLRFLQRIIARKISLLSKLTNHITEACDDLPQINQRLEQADDCKSN